MMLFLNISKYWNNCNQAVSEMLVLYKFWGESLTTQYVCEPHLVQHPNSSVLLALFPLPPTSKSLRYYSCDFFLVVCFIYVSQMRETI